MTGAARGYANCRRRRMALSRRTPRYGRCEGSKRLVAYGPFGHWKTTTFLAALRHDRITAPSDSDGPINGAKASGNVSVLISASDPGCVKSDRDLPPPHHKDTWPWNRDRKFRIPAHLYSLAGPRACSSPSGRPSCSRSERPARRHRWAADRCARYRISYSRHDQ